MISKNTYLHPIKYIFLFYVYSIYFYVYSIKMDVWNVMPKKITSIQQSIFVFSPKY